MNRGIVDTSNSPHARLTGVPVRAVTLRDGFWKPRLEANARSAIPREHELLEEHGRLDNFRRVYGASGGQFSGGVAPDSDVYKWMEAVAFVLQSEPDSPLRETLEHVIDLILPAQREDGYLDTFFEGEHSDRRYTDFHRAHELYSAGHLFQAAIAHHRATGETRLLECALRFADHLCRVIPTIEGAHAGHPEIEMALVELYRETGNGAYLDLSRFLLDATDFARLETLQSHAVRALYFCCGGADYYAETGEKAFLESLEQQWGDMAEAKVYITGGVGGCYWHEAFGKEYELPNARAYAETCAAIANVMWNWRMLALDGEGPFADLLERTLYNGFLSGVSLDGMRYFYVNPMLYDGKAEHDPWRFTPSRRTCERLEWYECDCCPPNVERLLASLPGYFYSVSEEGVWVHLYDNNDLDWHLADGTGLRLSQSTRYPWDGEVRIGVIPERPVEFALHLRVPGWADGASVAVNGEKLEVAPQPGAYLPIKRRWVEGDQVVLSLPLEPTVVCCNPVVDHNRGSLALQRGPVVYCLEAHDNPGINVLNAVLRADATVACEHRENLLGGVTVLRAEGAERAEWEGFLYRPRRSRPTATRAATLTAIPYYTWNNRGPAPMTVWIQEG